MIPKTFTQLGIDATIIEKGMHTGDVGNLTTLINLLIDDIGTHQQPNSIVASEAGVAILALGKSRKLLSNNRVDAASMMAKVKANIQAMNTKFIAYNID